jgi:hypothetical protein
MKIFFNTDELGEYGKLSVLEGRRQVYLKYSEKYYCLKFKTPKCVTYELSNFEENNKTEWMIYQTNNIIVRSIDFHDIISVITSMSEEDGILPSSILKQPLPSYDISNDVIITSRRSIIEYDDHSFILMILKNTDSEPIPHIQYYDEPTDISIKENIKKRIFVMVENGMLNEYPPEDYTYWITGLTALDTK